MAAEKRRDSSQPIDVPLRDASMAASYGTGSREEDQACDTFLKVVQKCKCQLVITQDGHMILAESDAQKRDEYLQRLMELPNQKWIEIIGQAHQNVEYLKSQDVIQTVLNILQTNTIVASSLGTYFLPQITLIFLDMVDVYSLFKREALKLIETFLDKAKDQPQIRKQFVPPMMEPVLGDYARNVPDARESEVLSLSATIVNKHAPT